MLIVILLHAKPPRSRRSEAIGQDGSPHRHRLFYVCFNVCSDQGTSLALPSDRQCRMHNGHVDPNSLASVWLMIQSTRAPIQSLRPLCRTECVEAALSKDELEPNRRFVPFHAVNHMHALATPSAAPTSVCAGVCTPRRTRDHMTRTGAAMPTSAIQIRVTLSKLESSEKVGCKGKKRADSMM